MNLPLFYNIFIDQPNFLQDNTLQLFTRYLTIFLINFPLFCLIICFFLGIFKKNNIQLIQNTALYLSGFSFILTLFLLILLDKSNTFFQITFQISLSPLLTGS
jgi:hypothetical protein